MRFAIDGYNLLFALGKLTPRSPRGAIGPARKWLMSQVRAHHAADDVTVVFDGKPGRATPEAGAVYSGRLEADDLIEERIRQESAPGRLTIVSDDLRLREAARRKGCVVLRCLDYAERHLLSEPSPAPPPQPAGPPADDRQAYLEMFKHLDDDPELGEPF
jgi:hypothetical protein